MIEPKLHRGRREYVLFAVGDLAHGAVMGAATAAIVRALIPAGTDMALAMLAGMGLGMIVHLPLGLLFAPFLGMFHSMIPGSLIGMYGGMLFAMRDAMLPHSPAGSAQILTVGATFGVFTVVAVRVYNYVLTHGS